MSQIKILSWNCNMAFRKKAEYIFNENPDIIIIPECECPENLKFSENIKFDDTFWYGDNKHKGIGIFTRSNFKITLLPNHNVDYRYILPLKIENKNFKFIVFATWTQKPKTYDNYGIHMWKAIQFYKQELKNENVVIIGDFNSSSIWDKPNRESNHSNIVNKLTEYNIFSCYHDFFKEEQGKESRPTLFMHRKFEKPYHIDFCFASKNLIKNLKKFEVGEYEKWSKLSDHKPIVATFEI